MRHWLAYEQTDVLIEDMRTYFALLKDRKAADEQQLALFEAQKKALEQEHLRYLEQKVAFWKAVQSGDDAKVKEIGEITVDLSMQLIKEK